MSKLPVTNVRFRTSAVTLLLLLSTLSSVAQLRDSSKATWNIEINAGYKGIHLTGPSIHALLKYQSIYGFDLGYGYDVLNSYSAGLSYNLLRGENELCLIAGYGLFSKREAQQYSFRIRSIHAGLAYRSLLWERIVIGESVTVVKYLDERFSIPDYKTKQIFEADESSYFEIGVTLGYRFALDGLF